MQSFTKADLKTGMIVETRKGDKSIVLKDYETKFYGKGMFLNLERRCFDVFAQFDNTMKCRADNNGDIDIAYKYDIMKVWDVNKCDRDFLDFDTSKRKLLFDREQEEINYNNIIIDENSYKFLCLIDKKYNYIGYNEKSFYIKETIRNNAALYINRTIRIIDSDFKWLKEVNKPLEIEELITAYEMRNCCCK